MKDFKLSFPVGMRKENNVTDFLSENQPPRRKKSGNIQHDAKCCM
jgi:hypothetical protein